MFNWEFIREYSLVSRGVGADDSSSIFGILGALVLGL